jgi:hypothetical protein
MTRPNHITVAALARLPIAEIVALPSEELARLQQDADDAVRKAKALMAWLDSALLMKYADRAKTARTDAGKDFGSTRFADGEVTVVAELPKRVDWNQHELSELVERIKGEGDDPREYVEVSFKVSERKYASWPLHIRKLFEPARTVRAGAQSFSLIVNKEGLQ